MDQVPATAQSSPSPRSPAARAQASISNIPPETGVPGRSPQSRAAPALSLPQSSPEPARGGSAPRISPRPKSSRSSGS